MNLRSRIVKAFDFLTCSLRHHTPEEREFIAHWLASQQLTYFRSVNKVLMYVLTGAFIAIYIHSPMPQRPIELVTYGTLLLISIGFALSKRLQSIDQRHIVATIAVILLTGSASSVHVHLKSPTTMAPLIMVSSFLMGNLVFLTTMFPYADSRILLILPANLSLGYFAFMDLHDGGTFWDPLLLVLAYTVVAAGILYSRIYRVRREILAEYRARNQLLQTERLRVEIMEQQLSLAKEIQDSLTPPESIRTPFGATARFFQKKFHPLGGDWMAVRVLANGDTVFVVADVTGKGIGAALVVHALQSLWAQSLSDTEFNVIDWLHAVNRTLLTLGKNKPHTSTLGVLVLSRKSLTYYSAGHVPCYTLIDNRVAQIMMSRGNLVGFTGSLEIIPVQYALSGNHSYTVVIGTDGALPKGSRMRQKDLIAMIHQITDDPSFALNQAQMDDDQLLISIEIPENYGNWDLRRVS
ncbi:MAG: hypothetical protein FJ146_16925 [Deltaproteobacteria bacterium]|nr:hypothetical protein [Deltaproteobacteria bacterium]